MICIRILKTRDDAEWAKRILNDGGFFASISEDKFNNIPIQKFGVAARFRLMIANKDFERVTIFLAKKLKNVKLK